MSAPLTHAGFTFPGIHKTLIFGTPEANYDLNEIFGLKGANLIGGETGTREISCEMWLYNDYSNESQLNELLRAITAHVMTIGDLVSSSGSLFDDVVFLKQDPIEGPFWAAHLGVWKQVRLSFLELTP